MRQARQHCFSPKARDMRRAGVDFAAGRGYDRREYLPLKVSFDDNLEIFEVMSWVNLSSWVSVGNSPLSSSQQISEITASLDEIGDRVAAIEQNAVVAVDICDRRSADPCLAQSRIIGVTPGLAVQTADVGHRRTDRRVQRRGTAWPSAIGPIPICADWNLALRTWLPPGKRA